MIIKWGNIDFDGPYSIALEWKIPFRAAVYAVMTKPDPVNRPDSFRVLYFGETGDLSERGFFRSHHRYDCWISNAGSESNLYFAVYIMPNSTKEERLKIESELVGQYRPVCNF